MTYLRLCYLRDVHNDSRNRLVVKSSLSASVGDDVEKRSPGNVGQNVMWGSTTENGMVALQTSRVTLPYDPATPLPTLESQKQGL